MDRGDLGRFMEVVMSDGAQRKAGSRRKGVESVWKSGLAGRVITHPLVGTLLPPLPLPFLAPSFGFPVNPA